MKSNSEGCLLSEEDDPVLLGELTRLVAAVSEIGRELDRIEASLEQTLAERARDRFEGYR